MRTLAVPVELLERAISGLAGSYLASDRNLAEDLRALLAAPGVEEQPAKTNREIDAEIRAKALRIARTYPGGLQAWLNNETPAPEER